ncbi:MAG: DEAD/DEAH box helicase family protein [Deltaproteobacteria bacterium]|nr:DEAD/DEAH box helicase family protein [Deltaproteobacteria bacterium]
MKTEKQTRQELIDKRLALAGWNVRDPSQVTEELDIDLSAAGRERVSEPVSPYDGHRFADYALLRHGKPVAVVEAKKASRDAALGQEQALQYATNLQEIHGGHVPFVFYSNGYDTFYWESDFYPPEKVPGFPTNGELEWLDQRRQTRKPLSVELINTDIAGRDYQIAAIRSILEGIEAKRRKFLLVMATGTGKTRTATALIDVLLRARWAKRVLFLVDRIALQEQAIEAFKEYLPAEPVWPRSKEKTFSRDRRLYVTTYPTMLNLIQNGAAPATWISPFFFDLIIADESHRSIYNIYQQVLGYFSGVKLGLTATPRDHIDHDTFDLFECNTHDPSFAYTYEEAVNHEPPFLSDFEVLKVRSKFQLEGIKGGTLPPAVRKRLIAEGKDVDSIDFEGSDLERRVTNSGTNALIVREFMEESIKDPCGTLPGKSIIFAISMGHARRLQDLFDTLYPEHKGRLARVLVSEDRYVYGKGGLLDQFKHSDMPRVAISVDMLDTGVDVPEVVNLVFAKPVFSYTKFWQMIGRGTRVLQAEPHKRKPWCLAKNKFLIIDCWGNFDFFKMKPKGKEPGQQVPLPVVLFKARLDKLEVALAAVRPDIVESVKTDLQADLKALPSNNIIVADNLKILATVEPEQFWERLAAEDIGYLRAHVAPVLRARSELDIKAVRFETDVVELSTAFLADNKEAFEAIRECIIIQINELPLTVNLVAREQEFIETVLQPLWWSAPTEDKLAQLVKRLAPLMRFRQKRRDPMMKLQLKDLTVIKEWVEFGPEHERMTSKAYRERVEAYIRSLVDENPVLRRIQAGEQVSDAEVMALARLLQSQDPYVTVGLLRKVYDHKTARFIQFIRHILGLAKLDSWSETVARAFDDFIARHSTFTALQIQFLQTLRTFILQTGTVEKKDLINAPFTRLHPEGIRGVFRPVEIEEILQFTGRLVA